MAPTLKFGFQEGLQAVTGRIETDHAATENDHIGIVVLAAHARAQGIMDHAELNKYMLVGERMSHPVISITPETPVHDAIEMLKRESIRRAPVVKDGKLVGTHGQKENRDHRNGNHHDQCK